MKMTKLTPNQLTLMAAVLGVSNAGKDDMFDGRHAQYDAAKLTKITALTTLITLTRAREVFLNYACQPMAAIGHAWIS
jgi:hypothetical protein